MGSPDVPKTTRTPAPAEDISAQPAAEAAKKFAKGKRGAMSTWTTRGQSLGGGSQLK